MYSTRNLPNTRIDVADALRGIAVAGINCFQRNRMNEFSDCGYNQIQQNNRFSTHKLMLSLIYRLNATRSKYKGTGAGKDAQARMGS